MTEGYRTFWIRFGFDPTMEPVPLLKPSPPHLSVANDQLCSYFHLMIAQSACIREQQFLRERERESNANVVNCCRLVGRLDNCC